MKTIYKCEHCNSVFEDYTAACECESSHLAPYSIVTSDTLSNCRKIDPDGGYENSNIRWHTLETPTVVYRPTEATPHSLLIAFKGKDGEPVVCEYTRTSKPTLNTPAVEGYLRVCNEEGWYW